MKTFHYIVEGRVQGVAFRYYTHDRAQALSIKGTVKNLFNGEVEVYAQGDEVRMKTFEEFLHQGPPSAIVNEVTKNEVDLDQIFTDFNIIF